MTYELAHKFFKIKKKGIIENKHLYIDQAVEFYGLAINALEKQIPKKVKIVEGYALCPICNHCIEDIDFISDNSHKYCDCCGQALDWSEKDGL